MICNGSERGPVALPVFKIGRCPLAGQAGFDSQALPPSPAIAFDGVSACSSATPAAASGLA
jgi:hypothetical protein